MMARSLHPILVPPGGRGTQSGGIVAAVLRHTVLRIESATAILSIFVAYPAVVSANADDADMNVVHFTVLMGFTCVDGLGRCGMHSWQGM